MTEKDLINTICKAYITVMGIEKWNSLTIDEQHDAIMALASGLNSALN